MKLILYTYNLKEPDKCGLYHSVTWQCFSQKIQEMFIHAETVEYHDGDYIKILKARDRSKEACQMLQDRCPYLYRSGYDNFVDFLRRTEFSKLRVARIEEDQYGIKKVILER